MNKENRLVCFDPESLPHEGVQTEKPRDNTADYLKLQGLAKNWGLSLKERTDDDGDRNYEFVNDKGKVVMHIHTDAETGKYTLVEHGDFGERLVVQTERINGLAADIDKLAKKKLA